MSSRDYIEKGVNNFKALKLLWKRKTSTDTKTELAIKNFFYTMKLLVNVQLFLWMDFNLVMYNYKNHDFNKSNFS